MNRYIPGVAAACAGLALAGALAAQTQQLPVKDQKKTADVSTPAGKFALEVSADYLGMASGKTVVRLRLASAQLTAALTARGVRFVSGELRGTFSKGEEMVEAFRYPVSGDVDAGNAFHFSFLRPVPPGNYKVKLTFALPGGKEVGEGSVDLSVPELGTDFRPEMAPAEASTLPEAEAIIIADSAGPPGAGAHPDESKLRILPPNREAPVGLLRLEAAVEPPIKKVEFYLSERLILTRTRPPYSVELDLGDIPRRQTLRAVGYDETGRVIDEDAWAINEGSARVAVRVLPQPDPATGKVRVKVAVQSIGGGIAKKVELYLDTKKIGSWMSAPYEATIPYNDYAAGTLLRATAITEDGKEANDIRMLKGNSTTVEAVRVDVVQLHVSALDKDSRFVKGLAKDDFKIQEDGKAEEMSGFEVAENLPLNIGLVVDSSGSMEKGMPFVREATAALFRDLIRAKDQGFVLEFRDRPKFLQELTGDSGLLQKATYDLKAHGATALYDAVILGLYQFRTLQGRKALVVVTDGDDNRSHVDYDVLLRYARSAGAPIYFIAVNIPFTDFKSKKVIHEIAKESGGEVFTIGSAAKIGEVTRRIEEELRSQYVLAFRSDSPKPPGEYRSVNVTIAKPGITARTIRGYIP
ncbi:MAG TPA: VWA domain-containing protein [Thermoanaerobaculia bacterium]|nr:VWA domain-containing protein [Thermoanaerobaculia bacterium]